MSYKHYCDIVLAEVKKKVLDIESRNMRKHIEYNKGKVFLEMVKFLNSNLECKYDHKTDKTFLKDAIDNAFNIFVLHKKQENV